MDTVTHAFAGSVLARSASDQAEARLALLVGALAAAVPDLDFLFFSTRIDYLKDHRSWTHSFLVLPFLALAIALATFSSSLSDAEFATNTIASVPRSTRRRVAT